MSEASKRLWITSDDLISFYHTRAATNPVIELLVSLHIEPPDKPALQFMEVNDTLRETMECQECLGEKVVNDFVCGGCGKEHFTTCPSCRGAGRHIVDENGRPVGLSHE